MTHRMIAAVLAASLALTGLSAPRAAAQSFDNGDMMALVLGAIALGVVLDNIDDDDDDDDRRVRGHHQQAYPAFPPRPYAHDVRRGRPIPRACLVPVRLDGKRRAVVSARCLNDRNYRGRLPAQCSSRVKSRFGIQHVYREKCLVRHGYRFAGRRR